MCLTSNTPSKNTIDKANTQNNNNNSNIILNQNHQGVPCYNNINIYTSGLSSLKNNGNGNGSESNLKNYVVNKVNHHKKSPSMNKILPQEIYSFFKFSGAGSLVLNCCQS